MGVRPSGSPKIDVTVPNTNGRRREGVRIHRSRALGADKVTAEDGIPARRPNARSSISPPRSPSPTSRRCSTAWRSSSSPNIGPSRARADAHGPPGRAKLLATLDTYLAGEQPTRSDLEVLFRQLCHDHGLPQPRVNQHVAGKEVDFLFADHRLIVEADSWRYHKTRRAFESDRTRDVITAPAGFRTVRFTDRRLANDPGGRDAACVPCSDAPHHRHRRRRPRAHCADRAAAGTASAQDPATSTIATGLHVPWGIAFLPDGTALVSERTTGRIMRIAPNGRKSVAMRVPGVATNAGEGGLLGLAISPNYAQDRLVYAYYTTARDNRIARFRLGAKPRPIVTGLRRGQIHNGGRIAFGPDGKLYAGVGETGTRASPRTAAPRTARSCA